MAYSRWSDSVWYVYWRANPIFHKHQEVLACIHSDNADEDVGRYEFSYLDIENFIKKPNWDVWNFEIANLEKEYLVEKMEEWIKDVDKKWIEKKRIKNKFRGIK